jgi:hypothetical protein
MKDDMHHQPQRQTYLTPHDQQLLAALLRQSGAVRKQAEAISTAAPKPKETTTK